jgi:hypothetical protein
MCRSLILVRTGQAEKGKGRQIQVSFSLSGKY